MWKHLAAASLLLLVAFAFAHNYLNTALPKPVPVTPVDPVPAPISHLAESLAASMADRLTQETYRYQATHGRFPGVLDLWTCLNMPPLHNPINGSDEVKEFKVDLDSRKIGWVYDPTTGTVYPGVVFMLHIDADAARPAVGRGI